MTEVPDISKEKIGEINKNLENYFDTKPDKNITDKLTSGWFGWLGWKYNDYLDAIARAKLENVTKPTPTDDERRKALLDWASDDYEKLSICRHILQIDAPEITIFLNHVEDKIKLKSVVSKDNKDTLKDAYSNTIKYILSNPDINEDHVNIELGGSPTGGTQVNSKNNTVQSIDADNNNLLNFIRNNQEKKIVEKIKEKPNEYDFKLEGNLKEEVNVSINLEGSPLITTHYNQNNGNSNPNDKKQQQEQQPEAPPPTHTQENKL